jgi:hypothetical protein
MSQHLIDSYADIQTPLALYKVLYDVYYALTEKYPDHVQPFNGALYAEFSAALEKELAPHAYRLCAFAAAVVSAHPELVGLPKLRA